MHSWYGLSRVGRSQYVSVFSSFSDKFVFDFVIFEACMYIWIILFMLIMITPLDKDSVCVVLSISTEGSYWWWSSVLSLFILEVLRIRCRPLTVYIMNKRVDQLTACSDEIYADLWYLVTVHLFTDTYSIHLACLSDHIRWYASFIYEFFNAYEVVK